MVIGQLSSNIRKGVNALDYINNMGVNGKGYMKFDEYTAKKTKDFAPLYENNPSAHLGITKNWLPLLKKNIFACQGSDVQAYWIDRQHSQIIAQEKIAAYESIYMARWTISYWIKRLIKYAIMFFILGVILESFYENSTFNYDPTTLVLPIIIVFALKDWMDFATIWNTLKLKRKLFEFVCPKCGSKDFSYSFYYDFYRLA